jgi:hypothetical protein
MQWTIDILQVTGVDLHPGMKEAMIGTLKMDRQIMTEDILNQSHQQSVGGVFLVHHKSLQSTRRGTPRNTKTLQSPISVMSQGQLMGQRMLQLMKLMARLGHRVSPPVLKRLLRSRSVASLPGPYFLCLIQLPYNK